MSAWKLTTLFMMAAIIGRHACYAANCGPETATLDLKTKWICEARPTYSKCPKLDPSDCLNGIENVDCQRCNEDTYIGETSKTVSGLTCQAWNMQTPHKHEYARLGHHNHCRNPDGKSSVWCLTTNPEKRWEECEVRECNRCDKGFSNATFCSSYPNGHTMIYYAGGPSKECTKKTVFRGFTEAEKNLILKIHNELRQKVASGQETHGNQPGASNMMKLVWNDEIAATAQRWVDQCKEGHDKIRTKCPNVWVGQNFFGKIGSQESRDQVPAIVEQGIRAWYAEVELGGGFPSSNIKPFKYEELYGHYTAVVWATTAEVGCGLAHFKTEDEMKMDLAKQTFSALDNDGSGYISIKDLKKWLSPKLKEAVIKGLMLKLDTDGDGQLSLEEFRVLKPNTNASKKGKQYKYRTHIVCNYAVGGNHGMGRVAMYKVGKGCSDCPKGTTCDQTYDSLCTGKCDHYMCDN